jgi:hypothetical protein
MDHFVDKRLQRITEELADSEDKRLHARIEIDSRDELLKESADLIKRLLEKVSCECSPPCKIKNMSWFECNLFSECLLKDDCLPCLHCESKQLLTEINETADKLGNWFDDPLIDRFRDILEESYAEDDD